MLKLRSTKVAGRWSSWIAAGAVMAMAAASAHAAVLITEVDPAGSGNTAYAADWFELTNTGASDVSITDWKMDDNSNSFSLAVPLRGITTIAAGQTVVFLENGIDPTADAALNAKFEAFWFGANIPAGLTIGNYGGSGVGLSTSTDAVNIFDSAGNPIASVSFGATTLGATLDNAAGLSGTISTLSAVGTNGAFTSVGTPSEIGSPGSIAAVPEPASLGLLAIGGLSLLARSRK